MMYIRVYICFILSTPYLNHNKVAEKIYRSRTKRSSIQGPDFLSGPSCKLSSRAQRELNNYQLFPVTLNLGGVGHGWSSIKYIIYTIHYKLSVYIHNTHSASVMCTQVQRAFKPRMNQKLIHVRTLAVLSLCPHNAKSKSQLQYVLLEAYPYILHIYYVPYHFLIFPTYFGHF